MPKTLNPGPSQISSATKADIITATKDGILEISHRSAQFTEISSKAINGLRTFLKIPKDYKIFYTSSATEAMHQSIANCCEENSFHFTNGNFSNLFYKIATSYGKKAEKQEAEWGTQNSYSSVKTAADFISITHNETSTGVAATQEDIATTKQNNPNAILAIDITSSAGVYPFQIEDADLWLFSVQKCFGLPAGLGIAIASPRAFEKSIELNKNDKNKAGIFNFENQWKKMEEKSQTLCTPNVLGIYLLAQQLERWNAKGGVKTLHQEAKEKYNLITNFVQQSKNLNFFVKKEKDRSLSVVCLEGSEETIASIHKACQAHGIVMGKGYGKIKPTTIRIANFPAVEKEVIVGVLEVI